MAGPRRSGRGRGEPRLDPVRWRPPGRGALVRLTAVAALLVTAAAMTWSRPQSCPPAPTASTSPAARAARSSAAPNEPRAGAGSASPGGQVVPHGSVGVPVRLTEPAALKLVHPGDRVDLLRVNESDGGTTAVAAGALVLGVTGADDPTAGGVLLALRPAEAERAVAGRGYGFAVLIRPD
jgi:hypothetical protein